MVTFFFLFPFFCSISKFLYTFFFPSRFQWHTFPSHLPSAILSPSFSSYLCYLIPLCSNLFLSSLSLFHTCFPSYLPSAVLVLSLFILYLQLFPRVLTYYRPCSPSYLPSIVLVPWFSSFIFILDFLYSQLPSPFWVSFLPSFSFFSLIFIFCLCVLTYFFPLSLL